MTVNVKTGDRVRIVLEGTVDAAGSAGFFLGENNESFVSLKAPYFASIEVLAKQFKVGDTVEGDDYAKLPVGTVVKFVGFSGNATRRIKRNRSEWANILDLDDIDFLRGPRTIEYLP